MVKGFETFREVFEGYEDCYTIIGGTACDILMSAADLDFRATKDIDMILLIENRFEEFGQVFWDYIKAGGYRCGWKGSDELHFYRFTEPQNVNYPVMIELFSRDPGYQLHTSDMIITPLHISDEISSLSAIMLNEDYYDFMMQGRKVIDGIGVLEAEYLILFKMRAWVDLTYRKKAGEHVNIGDLKKHKNDVFRLFNLIHPEEKIRTSEVLKADVELFLESMPEENINLKNIGLDMELPDVLRILRNIYL